MKQVTLREASFSKVYERMESIEGRLSRLELLFEKCQELCIRCQKVCDDLTNLKGDKENGDNPINQSAIN